MQNHHQMPPSILIVEDDPDLTDLLRNILCEHYQVQCVVDVPAALACLERQRPEAILLDCLLPGGGAVRVLQAARELDCGVVLMSGLPDGLTRLAAFGCTCLQKPFRVAQLWAAIETACQRNTHGRKASLAQEQTSPVQDRSAAKP